MSSELVSIIVPVYNVEDYLKECAASIMGQVYQNYEAIFVDDGSTDSSGEICDALVNLDERIQVIHQKNKGLSGARNAGLAAAKGDYICFVDSDDMIGPNFIADMLSAIKDTGADLALCDVDSTKLCESAYEFKGNFEMDQEECKDWLSDLDSREYVLMVIACNKLFPRRLLEGFKYDEGKWHEDEYGINKLIYKIKKAVFVPKLLYQYRDNASGITGEGNKNNLKHFDTFDAYKERIDIAIKNDDWAFANVTLRNTLYKLSQLYFRNPDLAEKYKSSFRSFFENYNQYLSRKQYFKYKLFIQFPKIYGRFFI